MVIASLMMVAIVVISLRLNQKISSVPEIPDFVTLILILVPLVGLVIAVKTPMWLLFGSSSTFKTYCFKVRLTVSLVVYSIIL